MVGDKARDVTEQVSCGHATENIGLPIGEPGLCVEGSNWDK